MLETRPIEGRRPLPIVALWVAPALILRPGLMAHAATIAVNSTADTVADDGQCTLREAITAANTDTASGGTAGECLAGSGDDAIDLTGVSGTIHLTGSLPEITSNIVFNGPGQSNLIVRRNTGGDYRICAIDVNAAVTISGLTLSNGRVAGDHGGGIYSAGTLTLSNSTVSANSAYLGGGIFNAPGGRLTLSDSTVSGNNASDRASFGHGGGIYNVGGGSSVTLNNSTVSGNQSSSFDGGDGGGLWNGGGATMILNNSTVSLNGSSNDGGGIYNDGRSTLNLNNSTLGNSNLADGSGGGVWNGNDGTVNVKNSIVAHNLSNADGPDCYNSATLTSLNYNLVGDSSACPFTAQSDDRVDADPLLGALQDNGGSTETCALLLGSPAFDAIPIESCTDHQGTPILTDQRGVSRPQGPACDMGAYEAQSADLSLGKTVDEVSPAVAETVVFAVRVTNNGPLAATGVVISDVLPLGLSYVSFVTDQGIYASSTGEWDVGSLTAGLSVTLILTATVGAGMEGSTITNTAAVAATDQFDSYVANDTAVASVVVEEQEPTECRVYLPFTGRNYTPPITFPLYIGDAIPVRPAAYQGEVFYSTYLVQLDG